MPTPHSTRGFLRVLVVLNIFLFILTIALGFVGMSVTEKALAEKGIKLDSEELQAKDIGPIVLTCTTIIFLIPAVITSWIGLFLNKNWARWLFLAVVVVSHLLSLITSAISFSYDWQLPNAMGDIESVIDGAILVLAFFSPASTYFERKIESY